MRQLHRALVPGMCGLAGAAVGASAALLWLGDFEPDWIEATGTWFGAVATVLALLWAVRSFRADQADREQQRSDHREAQQVALVVSEQQALEEAKKVALLLRGGGGYGSPGEMIMTSLNLEIQNLSQDVARITDLRLDPPLDAGVLPRLPIIVQPYKSFSHLISINPLRVEDDSLSGAAWGRSGGVMVYSMGAGDWERKAGDQSLPERI